MLATFGAIEAWQQPSASLLQWATTGQADQVQVARVALDAPGLTSAVRGCVPGAFAPLPIAGPEGAAVFAQ